MQNIYSIRHKSTAQYFGGFDAKGEPIWTSAEAARRETMLLCECQARLFRCRGINAQIKPVANPLISATGSAS